MPASFADHVVRLTDALEHRASITEEIERHLLNVQGKPLARERDRSRFEHLLTACFGAASSRELEAAHVADGFEPVILDRQAHQFDPLELIVRASNRWDQTRWPGRAGRLTVAHVIFAAVVTRQLELLSLRAWDAGGDGAEARLRTVQELLDRLNNSTAAPTFVRDVRWLIQTAQGPLTRHLGPYFTVAERITSLPIPYRIRIHEAGAMLAGGHLRSQLRYRAAESGLPLDHPEVTAVTRNSNSMDVALLVGDLVPLLQAYEAAAGAEGVRDRRDLADAILQGLSADPELLVTRLDLLGPCTTIEDVFITRDAEGVSRLSASGERHHTQLALYRTLIARLAPRLRDDVAAMSPAETDYSPLGVTYGFCADLFYDIAGGKVASPLEDVFKGRRDAATTMSSSIEWAKTMRARVMSAIERRVAHGDAPNASPERTARLLVLGDAGPRTTLGVDAVDAQEHVVTSDVQRALASGATAFPRGQIANDRREARFLASAEVDGKWFGVSKVIVTALLARGHDAVLHDIPAPLVDILKLTCPDVVV